MMHEDAPETAAACPEFQPGEWSAAPYYFPPATGRYEVKPGLVPLGTDFGNGGYDRQIFQLDARWWEFRQAKLRSRAERLSKYYQTQDYSAAVAGQVAHGLAHRLVQEHPQWFQLQTDQQTLCFHSRLTGDTLWLGPGGELQQVEAVYPATPPYASALDALACQVQEDITVTSRDQTGRHWVSAIHLCLPNYWAAEAKIGQDFAAVHAPVAGMETMNMRGAALVHTMITRPPMVRFAWGLTTDQRLNHHPEPPPAVAPSDWLGRQFDPNQPQLYVRVERQVVWGLPDCHAALFTIRTYFHDCQRLTPAARSHLIAALRSMPPASLAYKGLAASQTAMLNWLEQG